MCRVQQELESTGLGSDGAENPALMSELRALRQRKDELEGHLISLQDSRKQLMIQLESLMKLLKVSQFFCQFQRRIVNFKSGLSISKVNCLFQR